MFDKKRCPHCGKIADCFNHGMMPEVVNDMLYCTTPYTCRECRENFDEIMVYSLRYEYTKIDKNV
jgi:hypothetical protein